MIINQKAEHEIHRRQLYITRVVFNLCEKHGIRCFLVGGSLLGAVKEQGILKGDKDIDIGMLRDDYEKFCKLSYELPEDLGFLEARIDSDYNWLFAKVYQRGTRLIPKKPLSFGPVTGIYVDIIPYDYISEDEKKRSRAYKKAKIQKWLLLLKGASSKPGIKLKLMSILGHAYGRDTIIRSFSSGRDKTGVVQNIVGGTQNDWFKLNEVVELNFVTLNGYEFPAPVWKRYLETNYPGWRKKNMDRTELNEYEVEYE